MSKTNKVITARRNSLHSTILPEPPAWLPILEKLLILAEKGNHNANRRTIFSRNQGMTFRFNSHKK